MKRFIALCFVAIMLVLAGCRHSGLKSWVPYVGTVPKAYPKEKMAIEVDTDGNILLLDNQYYKLELSDPISSIFPASGWRINLDEMIPYGVEGQDDILMITKTNNWPVICIVDSISDDVSVFFREDIAREGISSFDYSQFDIYYNDVNVGEDTRIKCLWDYHIHTKDNVSYGMLMEGSHQEYSLTFVHKQETAIQYELQFRAYDNILCMDNVAVKQKIYIPIEQLTTAWTE